MALKNEKWRILKNHFLINVFANSKPYLRIFFSIFTNSQKLNTIINMKKAPFILFLLIISLSSCGDKEKERRAQEVRDSLQQVLDRNSEIRDSLERVRIDSLSIFAWGDAKFGMSQSEALKTNALSGSTKYKNELWIEFEKRYIEDVFMSDGKVYFKMDELYRVEFKTLNKKANYIDDLEANARRISYRFVEKYGRPSYSLDKNIGILDFDNGKEFLFQKWEIGDKEILIGFGEVYEGSEYYLKIVVTNNKFPAKSDPEEIKRNEERKKEAEEKRKYQY